MKPSLNLDYHPATIDAACSCAHLGFREVRYADNYWMPRHSHEEGCFVFVLTGQMRGEWERQTFHSPPATLAYFPAGESHTTLFEGGVKTFDIVLRTPWIERVRQYMTLLNTPRTHQNSLSTLLARRLYREFQNRDNLSPLMLEGLTLELLALWARDGTHIVETSVPRWLKQACDFLHEHFRENLPLDSIAAVAGVHPAHLTRVFRQHYHSTIGDYVRRLRVEYASHLLATSNAPLAQVALEAGFADQGHFSRRFKSLTGMTPAQFQKVSGDTVLR